MRNLLHFYVIWPTQENVHQTQAPWSVWGNSKRKFELKYCSFLALRCRRLWTERTGCVVQFVEGWNGWGCHKLWVDVLGAHSVVLAYQRLWIEWSYSSIVRALEQMVICWAKIFSYFRVSPADELLKTNAQILLNFKRLALSWVRLVYNNKLRRQNNSKSQAKIKREQRTKRKK